MKVLVTTDVFPPDIGGPATYVPTLATGLARRGHEVTVVTWGRGAPPGGDLGYVFRLERVPRWAFRPLRLARIVSRLFGRARDADVILANGLLFPLWLANRLARRPIVAKVVGDLAWEYAQAHGVTDDVETFIHRRYSLSVEWRRRLRTFVLRRVDAVIVPSAYLAGLVGRWGVDSGRVHVIVNAVVPGPAPQRIERPAGNRQIVTVGRLVPHKCVDQIIETLPMLPGVELLVIGDGPQRTSLEARARALGCDGRVVFAGSLRPAEVEARLRRADAFVLNSRYEGLPHVVLEAFAAGLPVVATAVGGTPELVRDGESGLLIPPDDIARLRAAIQAVLEDWALRQRLRRGSQAALARHSLPLMIDATEALLTSVSGKRMAALAGMAR
jgi:glycosyltransferase involved in cell wall biosynthesis